MNDEPIIIGAGGIKSPDDQETEALAPPPQTPEITIDKELLDDPQKLEEAVMGALYRMERRQARELKRLHEKVEKKRKRTARASRRRNRK